MGEASEEVYSSLQRRFKGDLLRPGDSGYDEAASCGTACCRKPGLIARCTDVSDVQNAVRAGSADGNSLLPFDVEDTASQVSAPAMAAGDRPFANARGHGRS